MTPKRISIYNIVVVEPFVTKDPFELALSYKEMQQVSPTHLDDANPLLIIH